jgi:hypothetical protein
MRRFLLKRLVSLFSSHRPILKLEIVFNTPAATKARCYETACTLVPGEIHKMLTVAHDSKWLCSPMFGSSRPHKYTLIQLEPNSPSLLVIREPSSKVRSSRSSSIVSQTVSKGPWHALMAQCPTVPGSPSMVGQTQHLRLTKLAPPAVTGTSERLSHMRCI